MIRAAVPNRLSKRLISTVGRSARRRLDRGPWLRAPTDKVDDFQAVAFVQNSFGPAVAGHDVAIEFDGDAVDFHAKNFHEGSEGKRSGSVGECALVAVNVQFHRAGTFSIETGPFREHRQLETPLLRFTQL